MFTCLDLNVLSQMVLIPMSWQHWFLSAFWGTNETTDITQKCYHFAHYCHMVARLKPQTTYR